VSEREKLKRKRTDMKRRIGFVSNSSSSSFICQFVIGHESGLFDFHCVTTRNVYMNGRSAIYMIKGYQNKYVILEPLFKKGCKNYIKVSRSLIFYN
jgi:hypothetical protein